MYSHEDYKEKPFLAVAAIANLLHVSGLNLYLGSGVSSGFGLPEWARLVARIQGRGSDEGYIKELRGKSDKEISKLLNEADDERRRKEYLTAVHKALYEDIVGKTLLEQLSRSPLLLAVAALLTGSCRGKIDCVFTYNYDDLLEQYLGMLGLGVCTRITSYDLHTKADVVVNHVHGFLPQSWTPEDDAGELILSGNAYRQRRADIDSGWSMTIENSMYSKCTLMLGLSADDSSMLDIFKRAQKQIKRSNDYLGFWLLTPDAYTRNAGEVLDVGMCPIPLEKETMPKFVLEVCQNALKVGC